MYRRNKQDLFRLCVRPYSSLNLLPNFRSLADNTDHDLSTRVVRDNVWRAPSDDCSYIKRAWSKNFVFWEFDPPDAFERIKKLFDGRFTELRIGRMRHAAVRHNLISKCAF